MRMTDIMKRDITESYYNIPFLDLLNLNFYIAWLTTNAIFIRCRIVHSLELKQEPIGNIPEKDRKTDSFLLNTSSSHFLCLTALVTWWGLFNIQEFHHKSFPITPHFKEREFYIYDRKCTGKIFPVFHISGSMPARNTVYRPGKMSMKFNGVCESRFKLSF